MAQEKIGRKNTAFPQSSPETSNPDADWADAQIALRAAIRSWIHQAIRRQANSPWQGGHDEANYTCSWTKHYLLTGERGVKDFLLWLRDSYRAWSAEHEHHGFRADARDYVTHSFENHTGFITALCEMDPTDEVNNVLIEDVAHHIGNWVPEVPDWYDWDRHMIVAHWLGTKEVRNSPPWNFTTTRHARVAALALTAWRTSGKQRYLDWMDDFLGKWCDVILACEDRIPLNLYHTPPEQTTDEQWARTPHPDAYRDPYQGDRWAGAIHAILRLMLRAQPLIRNDRCLEAVRKALALSEAAVGADATRMAGIVSTMRAYQAATGQTRYAEKIAAWADEHLMPKLEASMNNPLPDTLLGRLDGGRKAFGVDAGDGNIRACDGPAAGDYRLGYELFGHTRYLVRAWRLAARRLELAAMWLRDGREHGCGAGKYIHGEGGGAAKVLFPSVGIDRVLYDGGDDCPGLAGDVAVMAEAIPGGLAVTLVNTTAEARRVGIRPRHATQPIRSAASDEAAVALSDGAARVVLAPGATVRVELALPDAKGNT